MDTYLSVVISFIFHFTLDILPSLNHIHHQNDIIYTHSSTWIRKYVFVLLDRQTHTVHRASMPIWRINRPNIRTKPNVDAVYKPMKYRHSSHNTFRNIIWQRDRKTEYTHRDKLTGKSPANISYWLIKINVASCWTKHFHFHPLIQTIFIYRY